MQLCVLLSKSHKKEPSDFFTFLQKQQKVASLSEKFFCSSLLEMGLFIVLTAHHWGWVLTNMTIYLYQGLRKRGQF